MHTSFTRSPIFTSDTLSFLSKSTRFTVVYFRLDKFWLCHDYSPAQSIQVINEAHFLSEPFLFWLFILFFKDFEHFSHKSGIWSWLSVPVKNWVLLPSFVWTSKRAITKSNYLQLLFKFNIVGEVKMKSIKLKIAYVSWVQVSTKRVNHRIGLLLFTVLRFFSLLLTIFGQYLHLKAQLWMFSVVVQRPLSGLAVYSIPFGVVSILDLSLDL